jgi:cytochrome c-type biogenesis protein
VSLIVIAFLAGMFTILAPCVVTLIPILLARTATGGKSHSATAVILGLGISIILFSILLKSTTLLLGIPSATWAIISGVIVTLFGVVTLWPKLWENIVLKLRLPITAQQNMGKASVKKGIWGDLLLGASLGPVFSACSPTYALIVAVILPADPLLGMVYLVMFVLGLSLMLALLAVFGRALVQKLGWGINPNGVFRKVLGIVLIVIGLMIVTGFDKDILALLVENGWYDFQINLESGLM